MAFWLNNGFRLDRSYSDRF